MTETVVIDGGSVSIVGQIDGATLVTVGSANPPILEIESGFPGPPGEKGDSPTQAEVGALVVSYLTAHPVSSGMVHNQTTPAATWTIPHGFNRLPSVQVYDSAGELVIVRVDATTTHVVITFPFPVAGTAVIS